MSLSLDTVFQVVEIVQKAVEIYDRIHDAPETISKIGRRMKRLSTILANLENHLRSNSKHALARLRPSQTDDLLGIIDDTREDCKKVHTILDRWENKIGPLGLQFKDNAVAQYVAQAYFALGSNAKDLESIAAAIDLHRREIDGYLGLMGVQGIQANHDALQKVHETQKVLEKRMKAMQKLLEAQAKLGQPQLTPPAGLSPLKQNKKDPSGKSRLSPSPSPPKSDLKLIFVDPHNIGRSICAEALTSLYGCWTRKVGGKWRIASIHSAGFFCKRRNNCVDLIDKLNYKHGSYKLDMVPGSKQPIGEAIAAVFDNKSFNKVTAEKEQLKCKTESRTSRGIRNDIFKQYDYIIVFTGREHDNMIKLRSAIVANQGKDAAPKGMGRVVHLGQYSSSDGKVKEILETPMNEDGTHNRDEWNKKVAQIKIAIRGFLGKEMDWTVPGKSLKDSSSP